MKSLLIAGIAGVAVVGLLVAQPATATSNSSNTDHKIGICHATGSKTNPYVYIVVDEHAAEAHRNHQDGRDIIGVKSAKDCVKPGMGSSSTPTPKPTPAGSTLGSSTVALPTVLPDTGASTGLGLLIGLPAIGGLAAQYLRSRRA
ncbi:MAG TPA: hypothetical protein VHQ86_00475 [Candidatus Saccharimonadia bacterium]|nr:hypothetical protein [Candidatus Saccharimonadia bacterium]